MFAFAVPASFFLTRPIAYLVLEKTSIEEKMPELAGVAANYATAFAFSGISVSVAGGIGGLASTVGCIILSFVALVLSSLLFLFAYLIDKTPPSKKSELSTQPHHYVKDRYWQSDLAKVREARTSE